MKKVLLGFLCLVGIMSCDIPQSVTIKGTPGVYLPLGSPFNKLEEGERLEDRISSAKIREMLDKLGDGEQKRNIYDYRGSLVGNNVQAYVVHYPIIEMKLDLQDYINDAMIDEDDTKFSYTIEANLSDPLYFLQNYPDGAYLTGHGPREINDPINYSDEPKDPNNPLLNDPLFKVSLGDMAKLVKSVEVNEIGLEMTYTSELADNVLVRIPAFGINTYISGTKDNIKNTLQFVNTTPTEFIPKPKSEGGDLTDNNEIEIFVIVTGSCSGTIEPEVVFEWEEAEIDTSGEPVQGEQTIKNELGDILGEGVKFKEVTGYIYVDIEGNDSASMKLTYGNNTLASGALTSKVRPDFPDSDSLPFYSTEFLPLTALVLNPTAFL
ncbi:MAG: hypothetical protein LBI04_12615 [Treponema sp.]|jgi:hypothetical protein|nr:hypothetical protein [Treponema sp.]